MRAVAARGWLLWRCPGGSEDRRRSTAKPPADYQNNAAFAGRRDLHANVGRMARLGGFKTPTNATTAPAETPARLSAENVFIGRARRNVELAIRDDGPVKKPYGETAVK